MCWTGTVQLQVKWDLFLWFTTIDRLNLNDPNEPSLPMLLQTCLWTLPLLGPPEVHCQDSRAIPNLRTATHFQFSEFWWDLVRYIYGESTVPAQHLWWRYITCASQRFDSIGYNYARKVIKGISGWSLGFLPYMFLVRDTDPTFHFLWPLDTQEKNNHHTLPDSLFS
jgi:hypothetical protein